MSRLGSQNKRWHSNHARPIAQSTIDEEEREKFQKLSHTWWNETGEFQALHALNALRVPWITNSLVEKQDQPPPLHTKPLLGLQILDAGSGGGILSEVSFSPYFSIFFALLTLSFSTKRNINIEKKC